MTSFNILDPSLNIFQNYFLDASAGTGKTFAIEHLFVRLITEGDAPLTIDQILAVTFTRKAAREMKNRIRSNLENFLEPSDRVQAALICFDEAQIFTIHGFCTQALSEFPFEAEVGFETESPDSQNYQKLLRQTIKDYFSLGLSGKDPIEMEKLLKRYRWEGLVDIVSKKVEQSECEDSVLGEIVKECRELFLIARHKKEIDSPDGILKKMALALQKPDFTQCVRHKYKAVIVDEFQDTDPIQFNIFNELFLKNKGCLVYFVGDPKQSIYGFRSADLYTYLAAAQLFSNIAHLDTNFRSTPSFVHALNFLFSKAHGWNCLPKSETPLPFFPVKAGRQDILDLEDGKGAVHFFLGKTSLGRGRKWPTLDFEEKILFPNLVNEINHLKLPLSQMVILVKDRFQAERLQTFLQMYQLPSSIKRSLTETSGFQMMKDLLVLLKNPRSIKAMNTVLALKALGMECRKKMEELLEIKEFSPFMRQFIETFQISDPEFLQLTELLIEEEEGDPFSTLQKLERLSPDEEPRLQVKELDENKISIMTLFASKGLEFEIVFALALASRHPTEEEDFEEKDAEKMRQLYVALTRAKKRVYIPLIFDESGKKVPLGSASPIELFAARWERQWTFNELYQKLPLKVEYATTLEQFQKECSVTFEWLKETIPSNFASEAKNPLIPPVYPHFSFKENYLVSFTSLAKKQHKEGSPIILPDEKTIHALPVGSETGTLIHAILEEIFENGFKDIEQIVLKNSITLPGWEIVLLKQIESLLKLPLDGFCLLDLKEYMVEMEFLFPREDQTIKGFADLVFCYEGKYYILDWKSNWLGPNDTFYNEDNLKKSMEENDYYLQAKLYAEALERYVKLFDTRPFDTLFGGAFYVFIRGNTFLHLRTL